MSLSERLIDAGDSIARGGILSENLVAFKRKQHNSLWLRGPRGRLDIEIQRPMKTL
jgi:hypothetical protein